MSKCLRSYIKNIESGKRDKGGAISTGIPSLGAEHLNNFGGFNLDENKLKYISEELYSTMKTGIINIEDVLIVKDGATTGKVSFVDNNFPFKKASINEHVFLLRTKDELLSKYLFYFLFSSNGQKKVLSDFRGATVGGISKQFIDMKIPLPPLEIQKQIANELDKITGLIEKRKSQIEKLDLLIKAKFVEMFGDPVTNEMGWAKVKFSNLGELGRGVSKHRPRNDPKLLNGNHPLIQTGEVANSDLYIKSYMNTYSDLGLKQSKMWSKGTLCITIAANIAKTAILNFNACFPDSIVGFSSNEKTNQMFVHFWFSFFQQILEAQAPESAQKNINLKILSDLDVITPPLDLQNKFAEFVESVEKTKQDMQKGLEQLELLYKERMQEYFE